MVKTDDAIVFRRMSYGYAVKDERQRKNASQYRLSPISTELRSAQQRNEIDYIGAMVLSEALINQQECVVWSALVDALYKVVNHRSKERSNNSAEKNR